MLLPLHLLASTQPATFHKFTSETFAYEAYDPMKLNVPKSDIEVIDRTIEDPTRKRQIPIRIYLPKSPQSKLPVLLFSHGLGGARTNNPYLGEHWSGRGYVTVYIQHIGSDESVWQGKSIREIMPAMKEAANGRNLALRVQDVKFVIDELGRLDRSDAKLKGRFDLEKIGMSGHSFGAMTTQSVSGCTFPVIGTDWNDSRIDAAVAFSPSPVKGSTNERAFGSVKIPWFLMTGTEDNSPIGESSAEDRLKVFPYLPAGDKYQIVLFEGTHSAFSQGERRFGQSKVNPNHHRVILGYTTAFWDAYVKGTKEAFTWLKRNQGKSLLQPKDTYETK